MPEKKAAYRTLEFRYAHVEQIPAMLCEGCKRRISILVHIPQSLALGGGNRPVWAMPTPQQTTLHCPWCQTIIGEVEEE